MHLAIIMDGNGRWASDRGLPRTSGHLRGASIARQIIEWAAEARMSVLTLYTFSTENWKRPATEIQVIFRIVARYIVRNITQLAQRDVRVAFIGVRDGLPESLCKIMDAAQARTRHCNGMKLNIALNYGGRDEIVRTCRHLAQLALESKLDPAMIDEDTFSACSDLADCPPPDLLVRTGGDKRLSNFLLWHAAYSELFFTNTLWPDFSSAELEQITSDFTGRDRRFGAISPAARRESEPRTA